MAVDADAFSADIQRVVIKHGGRGVEELVSCLVVLRQCLASMLVATATPSHLLNPEGELFNDNCHYLDEKIDKAVVEWLEERKGNSDE